MGDRKEDFVGKNFVSIQDFSLDEINYVLDFAKDIKANFYSYRNCMRNKIMAPLFFEKSTRTDCSFQAAMIHMNGRIIDFDADSSSVEKGETLRDTVRSIGRYKPDIIVIRHSLDGSAALVADSVKVPVINAGGGKNEHPTQTLLDLYTIRELRGEINGTKISIAGDLKYGRTVHSLSSALSQYKNCEIDFISPDSLSMPKDLLERLRLKGMSVSEYGLEKLEDLADSKILYMTRVQRERFPEGLEGEQEYGEVCKKYQLKLKMLENVDDDFKVMHPLPKVNEIEQCIDDTKYAYYFNQLENGLYVRMALVSLLLGCGFEDES